MVSIKFAYCIITLLLLIVTEQVLTEQTGCGVRASEESKWPWHVAVLREEHSKMRYVCAGTLISRTHVLTAAHCDISPKNGAHPDILIATTDLQRRYVKAAHKMENYTSESHRFDIAILELESEVKLNKHVQLACLFTKQDPTDMLGTLVSWEAMEDGETSIVHLETALPAVDPLTCLKSNRGFFAMELDEGMLCAGYEGGTEICDADSGGGLFFESDGVWQIGGVMSFTNPANEKDGSCLTNEYVVFTTVFDHLGWIKKITKIRLGDGDESPEIENCKSRNVDSSSIGANSKQAAFPISCGIASNNAQFGRPLNSPWMAIIRYRNRYREHCEGTVISSQYVLTSAFCAAADKHPYQVRLGSFTTIRSPIFDDNPSPAQDYDIECVIQHPDYNGTAHNIALIRLAKPISLEGAFQPICLPVTPNLRNKNLLRGTVTGWGGRAKSPMSAPILRKTNVTLVNTNQCRHFFLSQHSAHLTTDLFCVDGSDSPNYFRGNKGGPLSSIVQLNGMRHTVQYGIVSIKLNQDEPIVYTNVARYMNWIVTNMRA